MLAHRGRVIDICGTNECSPLMPSLSRRRHGLTGVRRLLQVVLLEESKQEFSSPGLLAPELVQIRREEEVRAVPVTACVDWENWKVQKKKKTVWVVRWSHSPLFPRRGLEETIPVVQVLCLSPQPRVVIAQNMPLNLCGSL